MLHVKSSTGSGMTDVAGSPAVGTESPGTSYTLSAGTYTVNEDVSSSYVQSFSGDCNASGNIALSAGDNKTCTITNNDISPVVVTELPNTITEPLPNSTIVPKFPNTGLFSAEKNTSNIFILSAIFILVVSSIVVLRNRLK